MNKPLASNEPSTRPAPTDEWAFVEQLADDMIRRWQHGERPIAEEYFDQHPHLWQTPSAALELIAEELALRAEHGQPATAEELRGRFPDWAAQVLALWECQQAIGLVRPHFPTAGDPLGEFILRQELGRGGEGRVFLAEQPLLAGRLVVLKLSPLHSGEHLCLARLQHSYIVPLLSAHEFPEYGLLGLCMPYFGGTTLASLLALNQPIPNGRALFAHLGGTAKSPANAARAFLQQASVAKLLAWLGACLADALAYAHERQFVHLDVKPSNVLIADDGTPMLLDFHLAHPPVGAGSDAPDWLGGTPGHMAPEHQAAFDAVKAGKPIPQTIDGRADVFTLGKLLLTLWQAWSPKNQPIDVGLCDILTRATARAPDQRYPTATAMAEDLRRHLADMPLVGVRNRSWKERWRKWRRRQPHRLPVALSMAALLCVAIGVGVRASRHMNLANEALRASQIQLSRGQYQEAIDTVQHGEQLLEWLPWQGTHRSELHEVRLAAERELVALNLHLLVEKVRPLVGIDLLTSQARTAAATCRTVWEQRTVLANSLATATSPWQRDLLDLSIVLAYLEQRLATNRRDGLHHARDTLAEAETLLGPSTVLAQEQSAIRLALGQAVAPSRNANPTHAWEHLALARQAYVKQQFQTGLTHALHASRLDPSAFGGPYYQGLCLLKLDRATEAVAAFAAAATLAPEQAWCVYNRGIAYLQADQLEAAQADFTRALQMDTTLVQAYLGNAAVARRQKQFPVALAEIDRAAKAGLDGGTVAYEQAITHVAAHDWAEARTAIDRCLALQPTHADAIALRQRIPDGK